MVYQRPVCMIFGTLQILSAVEQNKSESNLDFRVSITEPIPAGG